VHIECLNGKASALIYVQGANGRMESSSARKRATTNRACRERCPKDPSAQCRWPKIDAPSGGSSAIRTLAGNKILGGRHCYSHKSAGAGDRTDTHLPCNAPIVDWRFDVVASLGAILAKPARARPGRATGPLPRIRPLSPHAGGEKALFGKTTCWFLLIRYG
jgi:hypothetical protein